MYSQSLVLLKQGHAFRSRAVAGESLHRLQADSSKADSHMSAFDPNQPLDFRLGAAAATMLVTLADDLDLARHWSLIGSNGAVGLAKKMPRRSGACVAFFLLEST